MDYPLGETHTFDDSDARLYLDQVEMDDDNKHLIFYLLYKMREDVPYARFFFDFEHRWQHKELIQKMTSKKFLLHLLLHENDLDLIQRIKYRMAELQDDIADPSG